MYTRDTILRLHNPAASFELRVQASEVGETGYIVTAEADREAQAAAQEWWTERHEEGATYSPEVWLYGLWEIVNREINSFWPLAVVTELATASLHERRYAFSPEA